MHKAQPYWHLVCGKSCQCQALVQMVSAEPGGLGSFLLALHQPISPTESKQLQLGITDLLPLTQSEWKVQTSRKHGGPSSGEKEGRQLASSLRISSLV